MSTSAESECGTRRTECTSTTLPTLRAHPYPIRILFICNILMLNNLANTIYIDTHSHPHRYFPGSKRATTHLDTDTNQDNCRPFQLIIRGAYVELFRMPSNRSAMPLISSKSFICFSNSVELQSRLLKIELDSLFTEASFKIAVDNRRQYVHAKCSNCVFRPNSSQFDLLVPSMRIEVEHIASLAGGEHFP